MNILLIGIENQLGQTIAEIAAQKGHNLWCVTARAMAPQTSLHIIQDDPSVNGTWLTQLPQTLNCIIAALMPDDYQAASQPDKQKNYTVDVIHHLISILDKHPQAQMYTYFPAQLFDTSSLHPLPDEPHLTQEEKGIHEIYLESYHLVKAKKEPRISLIIYGTIYSDQMQLYPISFPLVGRFPVLSGSGENKLSLIHLEDAARIALFAAENAVREPILYCADDMAVSQKEFIEAYAYVHRLMSSIPIPEFVANNLFQSKSRAWSRGIILTNDKLKKYGIYLKFPTYKAGMGIA